MGLKAYERKLEREVTLPRGLTCCLREYGSPFYWRSFYQRLRVEQGSMMEEKAAELEYDVRAWAVADAVVVWIDNDGEKIEDTEELYAILKDPQYWELLQDIIDAAGKDSEFLPESQKEAIKKHSSSMPESTKDGGGPILDPEKTTLPSNSTDSGAETSAA